MTDKKIKKECFYITTINEHVLTSFIQYARGVKAPKIYISGHGGECESAIGIYDYIKKSKKTFTTIGIGKVQSALLLVLKAGDKRYAYANTSFMTHRPEISEKNIIKRREHIPQLKQVCKLYKKLSIPISKKCQYFNVQQAKQMGIIDKIL